MLGKKDSPRQFILATLVAIVFFLVTFLGLSWSFLVSLGLAALSYGGTYMALTPAKKIGGMAIEDIDHGAEIKEIFDQAKERIGDIKDEAQTVADPQIKSQAILLGQIGDQIISHLEKNYEKISPSRHFLDYYLTSTQKILHNYTDLDEAKISDEKMIQIDEKTKESLEYLIEIYKKQRDSYYKDQYLELEEEASLLETTKDLGGEIK